MELELIRYRDYTSKVIKCLVVAGLWPEIHLIPKKILSLVSFFSTFIVMLTVFNFSFQNIGNVMVLTRGMGLAVSFSSGFSKVALFILHHDDLNFLNHNLTPCFMRDLKLPENHPELLKNVKTFRRFLYIHAVTMFISVTMYILHSILALRIHGKYVRIYPAIYPFTYEPGGLVHWILYTVELSAALSLWSVTVGVDCIFGVYSLQLCGELRILTFKFRNLKAGNNYKDELKDCIRRHHDLIKAKNRLEDIFGLISIWLAISGALVLCSLIFQVTELLKANSNYLNLIHLSVYIVPKSLQIFSYAWYGNLIAEESGACLDAMYYSHWTDSYDKNFKRDILIVLAQEPLALIAKGCMLIGLNMFTKIVNTSVSYFFLLRTLNEGNQQ